MFVVIFLLIFSAVCLFGYIIVPTIYERMSVISEKRQSNLSDQMEQFVSKQEAKKTSVSA